MILAADATFYAVFGVFVAAFVVLVVVTVRWAVSRDRVGRAEWVRRQQEAGRAGTADGTPPSSNGHHPQRGDQRRKPRRSG
jgi:hypothetical protein